MDPKAPSLPVGENVTHYQRTPNYVSTGCVTEVRPNMKTSSSHRMVNCKPCLEYLLAVKRKELQWIEEELAR